MVDNKLKIRIQIKQTPSASDDSHQDDEVLVLSEDNSERHPLDWTKISIAILLLLSVLGVTVYSLLNRDVRESLTEKITESSAIPSIALKENQPETNENTADSSDVSSVSNSAINAPEIDDDGKTSAKIDPPPMSGEKSVATTTPNKSVIIPTKKPPQQEKASEINTEPHNQTYVARALLTQAIQDREPKDSIDSVSLKDGEVKTIYFYLQLTNLQDRTITISWYHNGKQDSKITMQVQHENWRTHASKLLNQKRLGPWRVELTDESGNTLAVKNFTVVQSS